MSGNLIEEIDAFLRESGFSEHRFGILVAKNGRLVERLRSGGRVWPDTEEKIRACIRSMRRDGRKVRRRPKQETAHVAA